MTHELPDAESKLRVQLAGLFRISARLGWEDSFNTHYTARVPGTDPPRFLMNPYGVRFDEMKASDLVTLDLDGNVVEETEYPVNEAGFVIHSAIHRDRHDARCVIHTHTHAGMAVAAMAHGLLPIGIFALDFHECMSYHDFEGPKKAKQRAGKQDRDLHATCGSARFQRQDVRRKRDTTGPGAACCE